MSSENAWSPTGDHGAWAIAGGPLRSLISSTSIFSSDCDSPLR
jgi:hypothetical protein